MVELIAKVNSEYKNVLSQDENIINNLDLNESEQIRFTPSYQLEVNEWFKIDDFSQKDFFIQECDAEFSTASLAQISNNEYGKIKSIAILQGNQIHFQRITPSLYVNKKTVLDYSGDPKIVKQRKQIEIKTESGAIYFVAQDTLIFKDISKIKVIFPGIEELHREATQEEVDVFMRHDFISPISIESTKVGVQNRKRIADIGVKYDRLSEDKKKRLISYAKEKSGVAVADNIFILKNDNDLKKLLYAMDQRYYYADIYEENRVANSVRVI